MQQLYMHTDATQHGARTIHMALINNFWILSILLFLIASPLLQVVRCQSDEAAENTGEVSDIGIVGDETDDAQDFADA